MEKIQNQLAKQMNYDQVKEGEEKTSSDYVTFDAFFLKDLNGDGTPEKVRGTCKEVFTDDDLYLELNVKTKGYLKDAKIDIGQKSSRNYYFNTELAADSQIKQDYVADDTQTIEFNNLNNGTHLLLSGKVRTGSYKKGKDNYDMNHLYALTPENLSMKNNIVFTGTWVEEKEDGTTQEVPISKTVPFQVDWYGTNQCEWYPTTDQTNSAKTIVDKTKQQFNITCDLRIMDTKKELLVKDYTIEGTLPQINGYDPISIAVDNSKITVNYDATTRKFTMKQSYETERINYYKMGGTLNIVYPLAAYEGYQDPTKETIQIPVKGYFNSYNNPNPEFKNPYTSNVVEKNIKVKIYREIVKARINITVGSQVWSRNNDVDSKYIVSKQKPVRIYNGLSQQESKDYYKVTWQFQPQGESSSSGVVMREKGVLENTITKPNDQFVKEDDSEISMENITQNIGIYFKTTYVNSILGENGWIKVYNDDTNELIETFDNQKMGKYYSENSFYHYASPIAHVRIETSAVTGDETEYSDITITHIKELNDAEIIKQYPTKAEFDQLKYIKSHVAATTDNTKAEANNKALYTYPFSAVTMNLGENRLYYESWDLSTQQEKDMKITIASDDSDFTSAKNKLYNLICPWQNGEYLLKMPKDIIGLTIQDVTTNRSDVKITHYETFEKEGNIYIKIQTKNTIPTYYQIVLNAKVTPNPASPSQDEEVELYAYNQNAAGEYEPGVSKDVYDVNENSNVEEQVGYLTRKIGLISSNSLLTGQKATQYDNAGNIAISPRIAKVDKNQRTANIGISVVNNYSSTISGITILGTIPTKGNQYILNQTDLGSTYSTTMNSTGIQVPEELKNYTKVYYTEQEKPTKDLTNSQNGWTTTPTDWSKIKSYLIDLGDYVLPQKQSYLFEYQVNIPEGLAYNDVSYAQHGVYFSLDTKEGKYATETEPAKLGLLITKEFDLNLTKYHVNTKDTVQGATYQIADEEGNKVTGITDEKGNLILKGLLVGRAYTLKETISPTGYDLNPDEVKFKIQDNANGGFDLVLQSGTVKDQKVVIGTDGSVTLQMAVEDTKPGDFKTIIVHHNIYDATTKQYTTNKVMLNDGTFAKDETKKGLIGSSYTTEPLSNIYKMYQLYETPKNANGIFTEGINDIYYYYVLKPGTVTGKTTKTASTGQTTEDQKPLLTDERGEITYTIHATGTIQDYKGNATLKIIDQLPASIDTTKSDLAGGVYSPTDKTITWTETLADVDVFDGQKYPYDLTKNFKVVYTDQDVTKPIVNTTYGQIILYQPDQSEKSTTKITESTSTVEQAYQTNIETKKIWDDQSNKAQKRPSSVTFKLEGNGQSYTKELTAQNAQADNANIWSVTFTDLPKYDSKGNLISYTLSEENVNNLYYDSANTIVDQQAKTITNQFAVPGEKVNVPVAKIWDDQNNQAGKRPNGVIITIRGNGLTREHTLTAEDQADGNSNKWQYTFTDLPKYDENGNDVNYTVAEKDLGNIYYTAQNTKVDQQTKTITNTFVVPDEKINVPVTKIWDDQSNKAQKRPSSVTFKLEGNGQSYTKELTAQNAQADNANIWSVTFTDLPKYDSKGNLISYTLSEENVNNLYYDSANTIVDQQAKTITNQFAVPGEKVNVPVTKVWDDQNNQAGKRPNGVIITIRGNGLTREHTLTAKDQADGNSNKWQYTFTDLPKYDENGNAAEYTVAEKDLGNIYYTAQNTKVDQQSKTITNTFAVPTDSINVAVQKVWDDQENAKNRRPNSVSVSLLKQGNVVENTKVELTQENEWKHTYENLPKYDENGNEFVYSVQESETNSGDLEYYETPVINGTNPIIITNRYKTKKVDLDSKITKESDATITNSQQEISYTIHYTATVNNYIGQAKVTIVDNLPYPIDTEKSQLDGGVYDENKKTITWTENIEHINTDTSKQAYAVDITKNIQVVYKNLDASQENISNEATGTIQFLKTETSNEVKTEKEVPVQIMGKVVAKYVDQDTKEEIETAENMEGKVGTEYTTVQKEIPNYDFVESSGNTIGHYQEGNTEVTYYYRKTPAKVIVKYVDEKGEELAPSETIDGYVTKPYETKEKEIENYVMDHVVGETKGDMTKEDITITYVYHKAKAEVIVKYLEKKTEKELAPSETISGVVGDAFETSRKTIPNYRAVDPEPKETKGNMVKGTTEIIYYYEEIPNGTVNIKYWDVDTNQEITYVNEKGKTTNYGYTIIGKVESDYQAEEKTIPYYDIVENRKPDNASGKIEEGKTTEVNYYYKKKIFNLKVQKKVVSFIVNGEEKPIENANKSKIEIHRKEIDNTNLQVKYQIIVQNDGGIEGTAKVVEKIPAGFQVASGTSSEWVKDTDGNLSADVKLQPNETKTWEVILDWEREEDNFGKKINQVTLTDLQNPAGFDETNAKDNTAEADVYVAIATGKEVPILIIVLSFFTVAGVLILGYEYECYRKERK